MSPNYKYFLDYFSNITTAPIVDLMRTDGSQVRRLRENSTENLQKYNLGKHELLKFKTSDGVELNAYMIKPHNFDPNKQYPVLMFQYSGPGSQQVSNSFSVGLRDRWHHMLSQNDIIIFCTDGRGTGLRGREFEQITNHDLGNWETNDQKEAASYLRSLPYVKKDKIGIWGWSYGGYMSSLAITKYPDDFNLAIAVAPVTNWKNYDTIYTERFMSTPEKNPNYDKGAPMHYAANLKHPFLLIHGTADDNVHLSNSVQLVHELVKNQKQFEHFFYPRSMHGMTYDFSNTYPHLYTMMTNFILKNFK
jgi:dipeptidyl-peptidase 4